uniref:Uncharacterized protein n=1 Tax=Cacopsylla melanoneura TaxID=428564 RepID=A0A8D9E5X1_9HEMI
MKGSLFSAKFAFIFAHICKFALFCTFFNLNCLHICYIPLLPIFSFWLVLSFLSFFAFAILHGFFALYLANWFPLGTYSLILYFSSVVHAFLSFSLVPTYIPLGSEFSENYAIPKKEKIL